MTVVVDASTVTEALIGAGRRGAWAEALLESEILAAPHVMPAEVTNVLRRSVLAGDLSIAAATVAIHDLAALPVILFAYAPYTARVWQLRANVTPYDAWYIALAEALDVPLATVDAHLARATGPRCRFVTPQI